MAMFGAIAIAIVETALYVIIQMRKSETGQNAEERRKKAQ